jgi:hypothetical protein
MSNRWVFKRAGLAWLGLGLIVGLAVAGLWPNTPLRAVATDRCDTFAMATVPLDDQVEAVCFLDFLTGDLRAAAVSRVTGRFRYFFVYNVNKDLGVDPTKSPRYMLVNGNADLLHAGGRQRAPSKAIIYVAEITSGKVAAYYIPWSPAARLADQPFNGQFMLLDVTKFRTSAARGGGGGGNTN